jgi:hypothetical protein
MGHRGSGRGPHVVEHASHLDAADQAAALGLRIDRLRRRQLEGGWSAGRADEIHTLEGVYDAIHALVDRRHAGPIQGSTPGELALAGAAPERIFRALLDDVASDLEAGGDPVRLFAGIPHLTEADLSALTTWAAWEVSMCTGRILASALVAVLHRAVQVSRMQAARAPSE